MITNKIARRKTITGCFRKQKGTKMENEKSFPLCQITKPDRNLLAPETTSSTVLTLTNVRRRVYLAKHAEWPRQKPKREQERQKRA